MARESGSKKKKPKDFGHELADPLRTSGFVDRLNGISYRYDYTYRLVKYLRDHSDLDPDVLRRVTECYNYSVAGAFDDPAIGVRILKSNACKQHRLCANCAHLRSVRNAMQLAEEIYALANYYPSIIPVFTTITIKNGHDIHERFNHLMNGFKRLQKMRKNSRAGKGTYLRRFVLGGLFSVEIKHTDKGLWHPHLHGVELVPRWVNLRSYDTELEQCWQSITKDSKITRVKGIRMSTPEELIKSCLEVCKYSMKQASMTPALQYEAYKATHNKRLVRRFGVLSGFSFDEQYDRIRLRPDLTHSPFQEYLLQRISDDGGTRFRSHLGERWAGLTDDILAILGSEISTQQELKNDGPGLRSTPEGYTPPHQLPEALALVEAIRDKHRSAD